MHTEADLIASIKAGNQQAFRKLIQHYEGQVRSTVAGMLGPNADTDDLTQEVFIRFFKAAKNFRGDSSLGTYLTRIAINLTLNEISRQKRKLKWINGVFQGRKPTEPADASTSPERAELKDTISKALQLLEVEFRTVVILRLVDGYSVRETAEILELPEGTVASRLARAQKKLKGILKEWL